MDKDIIERMGEKMVHGLSEIVGSDIRMTPEIAQRNLEFWEKFPQSPSLEQIEVNYNGIMSDAGIKLEFYGEYSPNSRMPGDPFRALANHFGGSGDRSNRAHEAGMVALELLINAKIAEDFFIQRASEREGSQEDSESVYEALSCESGPEVSRVAEKNIKHWSERMEDLLHTKPRLIYGGVERGEMLDYASIHLTVGDYEVGTIKIPFKNGKANWGAHPYLRIAAEKRFPLSVGINTPMRFFNPGYEVKEQAEEPEKIEA